jgi:hypothetical protein
LSAEFGVGGLQELAKLLDGEAGISGDPAHSESVDGIVTRDGQDALTVGHDDVLALTHYPEPGLLKRTHCVEMIDTREFGQG